MDEQQIAEMSARIADLERKVEWLYRNAGYSSGYPNAGAAPAAPTGGVSAEVLDMVRQGRKIQAIKIYRDQTGVSLKEAKDVVDGLT
jgi:large subunit ribosomal protein L7/L12